MPPTTGSVVTEIRGDLFDAPDGSALIHACNTRGVWGAGIAKAFREKVGDIDGLPLTDIHFSFVPMLYPSAYEFYRAHCKSEKHNNLTHEITDLQSGEKNTISVTAPLGTALLIPPQPPGYRRGSRNHWIICLFTSYGFGRHVSSPGLIINSTHAALEDLKRQIDKYEQSSGKKFGKLFACRFNSGLFGVPWERTRKLLDDAGLDVTVVYPPGDDENGKKD